jgi:ligand-binding SRPBCC domain-containing protein
MPKLRQFRSTFTVEASLEAVAEFHRDPRALKRLTPPPISVQVHRAEPLAEGSVAEFTLWFGPLPVRWLAVHRDVDRLRGFTDEQRSGPMQAWRHTHRFEAVDANATRVSDHIEHAHHAGGRGLVSRVLFHPLALRLLFGYRAWMTRRLLQAASRGALAGQ